MNAPNPPLPAGGGGDLERQALAALRKMRERLDAAEAAANEPLAIVGAACRFPGAPDIDAFWQLLEHGGDGVAEIPPQRFGAAAHAALAAEARVPRKAGLLHDVEGFDAEFFGITGREAQLMDPQQRIFLEVAWEALERAGIPPLALKGSRTGVFVGTTTTDYLSLLYERLAPHELDAYIVSGNSINATAGRVSYTLGLRGPAMSIDTACSSSLVAIDRACRSVRDGESRLAIAGGVNLVLAPQLLMSLARWGMLSPDGHCKTFDAAADGFVRAEGCGVVLLKKLSHAVEDGDTVWALVRGWAVNQAGASGAFAVPNGLAQAEVLRSAANMARIDPAELGYLEAHGTGTSLGDPIEMEAIASVYGAGRAAAQALWVGAVKSNVGHLEAAAGVTGLIKTVLALRHRRIPPNVHFHEPTPHIPWQAMPVRVPTTPQPFEPLNGRRLAAVSAFGFSGTNAHVVLEEAPAAGAHRGATPAAPSTGDAAPCLLLTLSARSPEALKALARAHADRLKDPAGAGAQAEAEAARTQGLAAAAGRSHLALRLAVSAGDADTLATRLRAAADEPGRAAPGIAHGRVGSDRPGVAFLFTGQGAQYVGMGRQLAAASPVFRDTLQRCAAVIDPLLGRPLLPIVFAEPDVAAGAGAEALLQQTAFTQPALFALQMALVAWWRSVGVTPSLVLGHSVGEFAAACTAGVLTLEEAATLVTRRGALMQALPAGGAMASVFADEATVRARIAAVAATAEGRAGVLALAGLNGAAETVVAGSEAAVAALCRAFADTGVRAERLAVSHAFHSPLMDPMGPAFAAAAAALRPAAPKVPAISSMTGEVVGMLDAGAGADPGPGPAWGSAAYWQQQLRSPVRWHAAMARALEAGRGSGIGVAVEIGPQPVLCNLGRRSWPGATLAWVPSLRKGTDERATLTQALGELYVRGAVDDWSGAAGAAARGRVALPTYPFQHRRHWVDAPAGERIDAHHGPSQPAAAWLHPLLGHRLSLAGTTTVFETEAGDARHGWVRDHRIGEASLWPATASLETALAAVQLPTAGIAIAAAPVVSLHDIEFTAPLFLPGAGSTRLQTVVEPAGTDGARRITLAQPCGDAAAACGPPRWRDVASLHWRDTAPARVEEPQTLAQARAACTEPVDAAAFHAALAAAGAPFGPAFRRLHAVARAPHAAAGAPGEACARLLAPLAAADAPAADIAACTLHPAQLDACLQLVSVAARHGTPESAAAPGADGAPTAPHALRTSLWVPARIEELLVDTAAAARTRGQACWGHARLRAPAADVSSSPARPAASLTADLMLWCDDGTVLARLRGVHFVRTTAADLLAQAGPAGGHPRTESRTDSLADSLTEPLITAQAWRWQWQALASDLADPSSVASGAAEVLAAPGADLSPFGAALQQALGAAGTDAPRHRLSLAALDLAVPASDDNPTSVLEATQHLFAAGLDALRRAEAAGGARLWFVTRGAVAVHGHERPDPRAAALWGLARVAMAERPELRCSVIDIDASTTPQALASAVLGAPARESQLALRDARLWAARLAPVPPAPAPGTAWQLVPPASGRLEDLAPVPCAVPAPGPGEVSIDVLAAGVNFRDVLSSLGMVPSPVAALGGECAGRIAAVGPGVQGLAVGDEVFALALGGLATRVCVPAGYVAPRPAGLTAMQAAGLPIACLTASYGLEDLAGLGPGQRVLVHAGTGGVGMAAVRLAQALGAEVLATAGSEAKRELLRAMGVRQVFDSRRAGFADDVRAALGGAGVHVLLNALAGEFIEAGLSLLEPGGCFLEMGKRGVWTAAQVQQRFPGLRYHVFDLGDAAAADATLAPRLFARLVARLQAGTLAPLPVAAYPMAEARAAFERMAQARHTGKLVLWRDGSAPPLPVALRGDALYLVSGGLGALGLVVAEALAARGARELLLLGRRAPQADAQARLTALAARGVRVHALQLDAADRQALQQALAPHLAAGRRVHGIVHCAGVVDDAVLSRQDAARLAGVLRPKLTGALNLAACVPRDALDFFVLFSAGAGWIGSAGQANYAAANTALDALAASLRGEGVPATAIAWGRWAGAGLGAAARGSGDGAASWQALGIGAIEPPEGIAAMFEGVERQATSVGVMPIDWPSYLRRAFGDDAQRWPAAFDLVARQGRAAEPSSGLAAGGRASAAEATPRTHTHPLARLQALAAHQRREALQAEIERHVRAVAGLGATQALDPALPLRELGLDSLMSVELRNALSATLGRTLASTLVFDHPTLQALTEHLLDTLPGLRAETPPPAAGAAAPTAPTQRAGPPPAASDLAAMSDEEAEAQLLAELAQGTSQGSVR